MFFAIRDIKEVEEFWLTYFMLTTNLKDYFLEENEGEARKISEILWRVNLKTMCLINLLVISLNLTKRILYNKESNGGC